MASLHRTKIQDYNTAVGKNILYYCAVWSHYIIRKSRIIIQSCSMYISIYIHTVMNTTILQLIAIYNIQLHVSTLYVGHHQRCNPLNMFISTFTNPTIHDVRRNLIPLPKLPHLMYSHLISYLDNLMMAYIQGRNM